MDLDPTSLIAGLLVGTALGLFVDRLLKGSAYKTREDILNQTKQEAENLRKEEALKGKEELIARREELEKEFAEKMTGVTLVGYFTIDGQQRPPKEERYDIYKTTKIENNKWMIQARIK